MESFLAAAWQDPGAPGPAVPPWARLPRALRYLSGLGLVVLVYVALSLLAAVVLWLASGADPATGELPPLPLGSLSSAVTLAVLLAPSLGVLGTIALLARRLHRRPAATLVRADGRPRWRRAVLGASVWCLAAAAFEVVGYALYPASYVWSFEPARFLPLVVVALALVPLQSAAEELLFRGYLMQGAGLALGRGWAALLASSVLFAAVHLGNPEIQSFGSAFVLYYAGIGVALGLATLLDDGLEVAIGAHAANNLWGTLVVTFPGSVLDTPALFRMEGVPPQVMAALGAATAVTAVLVLGILLRWGGRWRALGRVAPGSGAVVESGARTRTTTETTS